MTRHVVLLGTAILVLAGCSSSAHADHDHGKPSEGLADRTHTGALAPKLKDLGTYSRKVSTTVPEAQVYFDQGLVLAYAFNHAEAVRSFREAQRRDPKLAIAYWGEAYALGPNINAPMFDDAVSPAWQAARKAATLVAGASPWERDLIDAVAVRYAEDPKADRAALDAAYAEAMRGLARKYPDDPDVLAIAAESIMNTAPWNYWTNDGYPRPYTPDVVSFLERAIAVRPDHPLALHLHIHALEASGQPERAVPSGDRLTNLVPGAGHLVHMPAHIFFRVGRYEDAVTANLKAVEVDEDYISQCRAQGIYPAAYYPHNVHFLWIAYGYLGRADEALAASRKTASHAMDGLPAPSDQFKVAPLHTLVRFGRWEQALAEPEPAEKDRFARAIWHWARGMALAGTKDVAGAERELEALRGVVAHADFPTQLLLVNSPPDRLTQIGERLLAGEIASARGDREAAIAAFGSAVRLEDSLTYNEPPDWPYPARHWLGAELLAAGRPVEAEAVYLEDLERRPQNGWGLFGLGQALAAQGEKRGEDRAQVEARFRKAWPSSRVQLTSSKG